MSLQIVAALRDGLDRLISRTGGILVLAYLLVSVVYQVSLDALTAAATAGMDQGMQGSVQPPEPLLDLSAPLAAALILLSLVALAYVSVVAIRTFVAGERASIPRAFFTDRAAWAVLNLLVGGIVVSILFWVGLLLLVVPGIYVIVTMAFMAMYVAAENDNFVAAMRRSWRLTSGDRWSVLGLLVAIVGITFVLGFALGVVATLAAVATGSDAVVQLLNAVWLAPLSLFNVAVLAAAYNQLRAAEGEGPGVGARTTETPTSPA